MKRIALFSISGLLLIFLIVPMLPFKAKVYLLFWGPSREYYIKSQHAMDYAEEMCVGSEEIVSFEKCWNKSYDKFMASAD